MVKQEKFSRLEFPSDYMTVNPAYSYEDQTNTRKTHSDKMRTRIAREALEIQAEYNAIGHRNVTSAANRIDMSEIYLKTRARQPKPVRVPNLDDITRKSQNETSHDIPVSENPLQKESFDSGIHIDNTNYVVETVTMTPMPNCAYSEFPGFSVSLPELSNQPPVDQPKHKLFWNSVLYQPSNSDSQLSSDVRQSDQVLSVSKNTNRDVRENEQTNTPRKYKCHSSSGEIDVDIARQRIIVFNEFGSQELSTAAENVHDVPNVNTNDSQYRQRRRSKGQTPSKDSSILKKPIIRKKGHFQVNSKDNVNRYDTHGWEATDGVYRLHGTSDERLNTDNPPQKEFAHKIETPIKFTGEQFMHPNHNDSINKSNMRNSSSSEGFTQKSSSISSSNNVHLVDVYTIQTEQDLAYDVDTDNPVMARVSHNFTGVPNVPSRQTDVALRHRHSSSESSLDEDIFENRTLSKTNSFKPNSSQEAVFASSTHEINPESLIYEETAYETTSSDLLIDSSTGEILYSKSKQVFDSKDPPSTGNDVRGGDSIDVKESNDGFVDIDGCDYESVNVDGSEYDSINVDGSDYGSVNVDRSNDVSTSFDNNASTAAVIIADDVSTSEMLSGVSVIEITSNEAVDSDTNSKESNHHRIDQLLSRESGVNDGSITIVSPYEDIHNLTTDETNYLDNSGDQAITSTNTINEPYGSLLETKNSDVILNPPYDPIVDRNIDVPTREVNSYVDKNVSLQISFELTNQETLNELTTQNTSFLDSNLSITSTVNRLKSRQHLTKQTPEIIAFI